MSSLSDILSKRKHQRRLKEDPTGVILEKFEELEEKFEDLKKKVNEVEFELELDGKDFSHIKGAKGEKGFKGDTGNLGKDGKIGEQGISGKDGEDGSDGLSGTQGESGKQGERGQKGLKGVIGKQGKPPKHQIRNGFIRFENPDGTWGKWIRIRDEKDKTLGAGGGSLVEAEDLTSQIDGSNTEFTTNFIIKNVMILAGTQFPKIYRPTVDFTFSGKTITLDTSEVGAPQSDQTLVVVYTR